MEKYNTKGEVELFPQKGGWYYIRIPLSITKNLLYRANRGVIAIKARVGETKWDTSLLPMGDGTHFIALSAKVRKKENIDVGKTISIFFDLR
jgi:hypothetical protein